MTAPTFNLQDAPFTYDGARIHARGLTLAAIYVSTWAPPAGDKNWVKYGHVSNCWRRRGFNGFILWKPDVDTVFIAQLSSTPDLEAVEALAALAMGPGAAPVSVGTYPLALRLGLEGPGLLPVPRRRFRCLRLWPLLGQPAHVETVEGITVEFRITGTTVNGVVRTYAEAFVGRAHMVTKVVVDATGMKVKVQEPRAMLFTGDARHVLLAQSHQAVKRFTARLMDRLVIFAYERRDVGVDVAKRHLQGRLVARVHVPPHVGDVEFTIRLPEPAGTTMKFVGDYAVVT